MTFESRFQLEDGVQVRSEKFGLLFYNYRGPKLYFVPSKDLIDERFFEGTMTTGDLVEVIGQKHAEWPRVWVGDQIQDLLNTLRDKGLICEQSIC